MKNLILLSTGAFGAFVACGSAPEAPPDKVGDTKQADSTYVCGAGDCTDVDLCDPCEETALQCTFAGLTYDYVITPVGDGTPDVLCRSGNCCVCGVACVPQTGGGGGGGSSCSDHFDHCEDGWEIWCDCGSCWYGNPCS